MPQYMTTGASEWISSLPWKRGDFGTGKKTHPTGSHGDSEGFEGELDLGVVGIQKGIGIVNGPGTIDSDYRGEIGVLLINFGKEPFTIRNGERIAQMVISPVLRATLEEVDELPVTQRQGGGFGHTGI
jgi:dUTP pyrophosphatase